MKKGPSRPRDELRHEYDLSKLGRGVRGKYFKRHSLKVGARRSTCRKAKGS